MAKILGIDFGGKRVGIAVTDEEGRVAFPKAVLPNNKFLLSAVGEMIEADGVSEVVIGESHNNQGGKNSIAFDAKRFSEDLERMSDVTIFFEPEYYSSQEVRAHTGASLVDAEAAAVILNSFLTKRYNDQH